MSRASAFIARMGEDATLHTRALSARTAPTQWPDEETWADSDINIFVDEIITREIDTLDAGRITEKRMRAFVRCGVTISHMDRITYHGELFEVESVTTPEYLYGNTQYQRVNLVRMTD